MVDALSDIDRVYGNWDKKLDGSGPERTGQSDRRGNSQLYNGLVGEGRRLKNGTRASCAAFASPQNVIRAGMAPDKSWSSRYNGSMFKVDPRLRSIGDPASMTGSFKTAATIRVDYGKVRPFACRCCDCMPQSKIFMFTDAVKYSGLHDVLVVNTQYGYKTDDNPWLTKTFFHISFCLQRYLPQKYSEVTDAVLVSQRLKEAVEKMVIQQSGGESNDKKLTHIRIKEEKRAKSVLKRMKADISNTLVRFTAWFLHKLFGRLLSNILVHRGQMQLLQHVCKKNVPVIFLPTHRSHLDYILMTFVLVNYDIRVPHVAAGDNLLIPFFGSLMRGLGGFFIRRKLDLEIGKKDHVYRAVLHTYMEELLRKNENMEFFIEGGRTRTGKAGYPKGGLLSVLVESFNSGVIPDAYLVPVSISYDKLVDGNFVKEQMGEPKARETFWGACLAIYRVFMARFGSVRIDFSQPFSLREYLTVSKSYPDIIDSRRASLSELEGSCSLIDKCRVQTTIASPDSSASVDLISGNQRRVVQRLAEHVVYAAVKTQSILSTQLLALVLLTSHRKGAKLEDIYLTFDTLRMEIHNRDHDVSFTGETRDVIDHALRLLSDRLVVRKEVTLAAEGKESKEVWLVPMLTLPVVFELSYYANVVSPIFALESVLVNTLYGIVGRETWSRRKYAAQSSVRVTKQNLLHEAAELCAILKYEFLFVPPCQTLDEAISNAFDRLRNASILVPVEGAVGYTVDLNERMWAERLAATLNDDRELCDDDEDDNNEATAWKEVDESFELQLEEEFMKKFHFLKSVLSAILETYYVTSCHLVYLFDSDMPELEFVKLVHSSLKDRCSREIASCAESASIETVKVAIQGFEHVHVISRYHAANVSMISLTEDYQEPGPPLNNFIHRLERLRD